MKTYLFYDRSQYDHVSRFFDEHNIKNTGTPCYVTTTQGEPFNTIIGAKRRCNKVLKGDYIVLLEDHGDCVEAFAFPVTSK